ncbi:uncharacterized protein [Apostichopus japonicus]|uniref:uncharacterized protein isoform X2 n=1 Tax=Stichopus japonicus TaxID=307972 RepID=UPI003AB73A74
MMASGSYSQDAASHTEQTEVVRQILIEKGQPMSWETFGKLYKERDPSVNYQSVQDALCGTSVHGILCSRDFIALDTPRSVALLKLELAVVVNEKLNEGKFSKASHYFHIAASEEEKDELGHNEDSLNKSMLDFQDIFVVTSLSDQGSNHKKIVLKPGIADQHKSFFRFENDTKASALHKLKYFLFLCHGSTNVRSAFEYSRCFLTKAEKVHFSRNMTDDFVKALKLQCLSINVNESVVALSRSPKVQIQNNPNDGNGLSQKKSLDVFDEDDVSLFKDILQDGPLSWNCFSSELESRKPETYGQRDQGWLTSVTKKIQNQPSKALTENFVKEILKTQGYPMSWTEFKKKFLSLDENPDNTVEEFMKQYCNKVAKSLCMSKDFVALNTPFHRNRLKLQLILENRSRSNKPSKISLVELKEQFEEIATYQEIVETRLNCQSFQEFLLKFPKVFVVKNDFVTQCVSALKFLSFFGKEKEGAKPSVMNKLNYFVNICGDNCNISFACKFLQTHLFLKKELELVNSVDKVVDLIKAPQGGKVDSDVGGQSDAKSNNEVQIEILEDRKSTVVKTLRAIESILQQRDHPMLWRDLEENVSTFEETRSWIANFKDLPTLETQHLIYTQEFISQNTPKDRAFLKLCLLVRINLKYNGNCPVNTLHEQVCGIGSSAEKKAFNVDFEPYLENFPSVFVMNVDTSSLETVVHPGKDMPCFENLFQLCEDHQEDFCLQCQLTFFIYLSGGRSHFNRAFGFTKLIVELAQRGSLKHDQKIETSEFEKLIENCSRIHLAENLILTLLIPSGSSHTGSKGNQTAAISDVNRGLSQGANANIKGPPPPKESPMVQSKGSDQTVPMPLSLPEKIPTSSMDSDVGSQSDAKSKNEVQIEILEERKSTVVKTLRAIESILQQRDHPMLWRDLEESGFTFEETRSWIANFKDLPTLETHHLICTQEFISQNTPKDRAFLKLCLLVRINLKYNGNCPVNTLHEQSYGIESSAEKKVFNVDFEAYLNNFSSVFVMNGDASSLETVVHPGKDMPCFENLFQLCEDHQEDFCLQCQLTFFIYLSGGKSHFNKAFGFTKLIVELAQRGSLKHDQKTETSEFEKLLENCSRIHLAENLIITLLIPSGSSHTGSKGIPTAAISDVNRGVSQGAKANIKGPPPPKESPTVQSKGSDQTVPMPLSLPEKGPTSSMDSDVGSQSDAKSNNEVQIEILEERKSTVVKTLRAIESILQQRDHPMLWRDLEESGFTFEETRSWIANFKDLPTLETQHLIYTQEFISQNTPKDRAFLKLCLLVRINLKYNGNCPVNTLHEQGYGIGSQAEKKVFNDDFETYLKNFPSMFVMNVDTSSLETVVHPGKDMPCFDNLFQLCEDHQEDFCLQCQLTFFIYLSGGKSHFNKAFGFTKLIVELAQRGPLKDDQKIETSEFEKLIENCSRIHRAENLDITLLSPSVNSHTGSKGILTAAIPDVNRRVSQGAKANIKGPPPPKESPTVQSKGSETDPMPLSLPEKGPTSSILPVQGALPSIPDSEREVPPTSEEGALSSSSSLKSISSDPTKTKTARKRSKRKKKKADAAVSMATETKVDVKVEVIGNENRLTMLIAQMLWEVNPIISVMHSQDILVVLNWSGTGFLLPIPPMGAGQVNHQYDARWTKFCDFLKNRKVVMVTFDCESVAKVLLGRLDLKLVTVFDIKCGVQLLSSESPSNSPSYRNVTELCQRFALPGPGRIIPHIIGDLDLWATHKNIQLNKDEVLLMIKNAASLIPTVYRWIYHELHSHGALKELERLTTKKLDVMYTEAENESSLAADDSSTSTTTPTPSSYKSSTSLKASHSTGEMKMFPELPGQNMSLQSSGSQNSMMVPPGQRTSLLSSFSQNSMMLTENLVQSIPPQNDWFSEEIGDIPLGSSELEGSFDQKVYCLRKTEDGGIIAVLQEEANSYDSNLSGLTEELVKHFAEKNSESIIQLLTLLGDDIFTTLGEQLQGQSKNHMDQLSEIVLDVGRCAEARLHKNIKGEKPVVLVASSKVITKKALQEIEENDVLTGFDDNRCGVEGCLHSVRGVRNRTKKLIGLTVRVALPLLGCADMMYDIALSGRSILILGCPGVGKTTLLRELARCLSDTEKKKVVVIDTYNEIAGDSDTPHFSIGSARRLQVYNPEEQHQVISESAKNHSPEVVIIDQIELKSDVTAATRLPRYGIQVIAGINCNSVMNLIEDQNLSQIFQIRGSNMLDDMQSLDSAGALAQSKVKSAFQALVEMKESDCWHIHDLNHTWTNISAGQAYSVQERTRIGLNHRQPGWEQQIILRETLISPQETFEF